VRAAEHHLSAGLVASIDQQLRAHASGDRLDEVLDELARIRAEAGWPPVAAPIGQILGSQALLNVLSASRYATVVDGLPELLDSLYGTPPGPIDPAVKRAVTMLTGDVPDVAPVDLDALQGANGLASSDEELVLLALFGEEAEPLLKTIRGRSRSEDALVAGRVDQQRAELIREVVRIVQESGVSEVSIEEAGMRVSVKRTEEAVPVAAAPAISGSAPAVASPSVDGLVRVLSPMVGTFYRSSQPGAPPFVEEGETVAKGQTLCILEAMKLMNPLTADVDGVVSKIHVENAQPVEFEQLLFELEPLAAPPLDAF
jgi:oxaloacetate decarboxylase alpha subunit